MADVAISTQLSTLSDRELEVAQLVALGLSNKEIALLLPKQRAFKKAITENTVKVHLVDILNLLNPGPGRNRIAFAKLWEEEMENLWDDEQIIPAMPLGAKKYVLSLKEPKSSGGKCPPLSARHREVLEQLLIGVPNKVIGRNLGITEITVRAHLTDIQKLVKLPSRNRVALAIWYKNNKDYLDNALGTKQDPEPDASGEARDEAGASSDTQPEHPIASIEDAVIFFPLEILRFPLENACWYLHNLVSLPNRSDTELTAIDLKQILAHSVGDPEELRLRVLNFVFDYNPTRNQRSAEPLFPELKLNYTLINQNITEIRQQLEEHPADQDLHAALSVNLKRQYWRLWTIDQQVMDEICKGRPGDSRKDHDITNDERGFIIGELLTRFRSLGIDALKRSQQYIDKPRDVSGEFISHAFRALYRERQLERYIDNIYPAHGQSRPAGSFQQLTEEEQHRDLLLIAGHGRLFTENELFKREMITTIEVLALHTAETTNQANRRLENAIRWGLDYITPREP